MILFISWPEREAMQNNPISAQLTKCKRNFHLCVRNAYTMCRFLIYFPIPSSVLD